MRRKIIKLFLLPLVVLVLQAAATEPLVGTWTLSSQTAKGQKAGDDDQMTLRVYPVGDGLEFAFSVPVNGVHMVGLKFTAVHLDGKPGSIEDVRGKKIGDVKVTKLGRLEYKAVLEGPNRPTTESKMTVSADEKTLTSESGGKVQVFSRR
jgi:hypothetical protein